MQATSGLLTKPNLTANGNIPPCVFLTLVAGTAQLAVIASDPTAVIIGVSGRNTRYPPGSPADDGYNAIAGEELIYHSAFEIASLKLGNNVTDATLPLTTDGNGLGVSFTPTNTTKRYFGATPLRLGSTGEFIPVWVMPPVCVV